MQLIRKIFTIKENIKINNEEIEEDIKYENWEEPLEKYIINEKWKLFKKKIMVDAKNKIDQIIIM